MVEPKRGAILTATREVCVYEFKGDKAVKRRFWNGLRLREHKTKSHGSMYKNWQ